jgi:hypothetical protein
MKIRQQRSAIDAYHEGHRSMEDRVYRLLVSRGKRGATILEVASALSIELDRSVASNEVTGRLTDLKNEKHGTRGYRVIVAPRKRACEVNGRNKIFWVAVGYPMQLDLIGGHK